MPDVFCITEMSIEQDAKLKYFQYQIRVRCVRIVRIYVLREICSKSGCEKGNFSIFIAQSRVLRNREGKLLAIKGYFMIVNKKQKQHCTRTTYSYYCYCYTFAL